MAKYVFSVLFLVTLFFSGLSCNTAVQNSAVESMKDSDMRIYEVFGMDCPGCHGGLEKLVKKIPAVQDAQANWQKQQLIVTVRPDTKLEDEDVYDAIKRANFTPGERIQ